MNDGHRLELNSFLGSLEADHPALEIQQNEQFRTELEFFLSLDRVPGFDDKKKDLFTLPKEPENNEANREWFSNVAELGAIWLVGRKLGLKIQGFESVSPRRIGEKKSCDFSAACKTEELFF